MELKLIDNSRVVYLLQARRPAGQLFLPAALEALLGRYHFQKFPTPQELLGETHSFQVGLFEGVGINEFSLYPDGMIVSSRANTDLLDAFIDDVMTWAESALGVFETDVPPKERHYESSIVVSMKMDKEKSFPYLANLNHTLTTLQEKYGLRPFEFDFSALQVANDATAFGGRKPMPFTIARRINVPFEAEIYYATAPLKTNDHLEVLTALEAALS